MFIPSNVYKTTIAYVEKDGISINTKSGYQEESNGGIGFALYSIWVLFFVQLYVFIRKRDAGFFGVILSLVSYVIYVSCLISKFAHGPNYEYINIGFPLVGFLGLTLRIFATTSLRIGDDSVSRYVILERLYVLFVIEGLLLIQFMKSYGSGIGLMLVNNIQGMLVATIIGYVCYKIYESTIRRFA
jgi:hypothetical protein